MLIFFSEKIGSSVLVSLISRCCIFSLYKQMCLQLPRCFSKSFISMYPKLFSTSRNFFQILCNLFLALCVWATICISSFCKSFLFRFSICSKMMLDYFLFFWGFILCLFTELAKAKSLAASLPFSPPFFYRQNFAFSFVFYFAQWIQRQLNSVKLRN